MKSHQVSHHALLKLKHFRTENALEPLKVKMSLGVLFQSLFQFELLEALFTLIFSFL